MTLAVDTSTLTRPLGANARLWAGVRRVVERAPSLADLRTHRVELLAAGYRRERRLSVPESLRTESRIAATRALAAPLLLERVRAACDGPIVLMKGPEVAAHYPRPELRPYIDLDLLVPDACAAQRSLREAGFRPVGDERLYRGIHHLRPLLLEGFPLCLEVHARPKWPERLQCPSTTDFLAAAEPTTVPVDGILRLSPAHHALVLAAHSWAHAPLGRLSEIIDIAAVREGASRVDVEAAARTWGLERIWNLTSNVADALFLGGRVPLPLRLWAKSLVSVRERTVLEFHTERWLSGFWALEPAAALRAADTALRRDLRPAAGESYGRKVRRSRTAIRNARVRRSRHNAELVERSLDAPHPLEGMAK